MNNQINFNTFSPNKSKISDSQIKIGHYTSNNSQKPQVQYNYNNPTFSGSRNRLDSGSESHGNFQRQQSKPKTLSESHYFKSTGSTPYGRRPRISSTLLTERTRLVLLCTVWYTLSAVGNVFNKYLLVNYFPGYPTTLSFVQISCICLILPMLFKLWRIGPSQKLTRGYTTKYIIPLALGKFLSSISSNFSIYKVPVSYAHTIKASMPIFTVLITRILLKETHSLQVYLSLMPITFGVGIATVTEIQFNWSGMNAAFLATACFSLQNIFSKRVLKQTRIHHLRLLHLISNYCFILLLPVWLLVDFKNYSKDEALKNLHENYLLSSLYLFASGSIMLAQNIVAFSVISILSPLSYSVANATKRIIVILFSIVTLKNPVTLVNLFGMGVSISGVFVYQKIKIKEDCVNGKTKNLRYSLPTTTKDLREGFNLTKGGVDFRLKSTSKI